LPRLARLGARSGNPDRDGLRIDAVSAPSDARRTGRGLVAGLITGFVAVSAGQLVAGIARPQGSPVAAVGSMAIDFTPPAVKSFAISTFGSHDKLVLVSGVLVVLAVFAAMIGALASIVLLNPSIFPINVGWRIGFFLGPRTN